MALLSMHGQASFPHMPATKTVKYGCIIKTAKRLSSPYRYKITLLKPSTKALDISSKISIRMDNRGFLSLQYMIINDDGETCYVEYLVGAYPFLVLQFVDVIHKRKPLSYNIPLSTI